MLKLLRLDPPLGPQIVSRAYAVGLVALAALLVAGVYGGVLGCVAGLRSSSPGAAVTPLAATAAYVVGLSLAALGWRVVCELLLALFAIRDDLHAIREKKA
jgi:hypothetical protein